MGKIDYRPVNGLLKWGDRDRAHHVVQDYPIPLALAFIKTNRQDIDLWRKIAEVSFELPDEYLYAILAYNIEPQETKVEWPKKKVKLTSPPFPFRSSEKHWMELLENCDEVANQMRIENPDDLPKGIKKRMSKKEEWV